MNKDILNILPYLLKRLSIGEQINIPRLSEELGIPQKTIQDNFKKYLQPIENADIHFDKSVNAWVARQGFLLTFSFSPKTTVSKNQKPEF